MGKVVRLARAMYATVQARVNGTRSSLRAECRTRAQVIHRVVDSCDRPLAAEQHEHVEDPCAHCEPGERDAQWLKQLSRANAALLRVLAQRIFDLLRLPSVYGSECVANARQQLHCRCTIL